MPGGVVPSHAGLVGLERVLWRVYSRLVCGSSHDSAGCVPDAKLDDTQKKRLSRVLLEDQGVDISRAGAPLALDLDEIRKSRRLLLRDCAPPGRWRKWELDPSVFSVDDRRDWRVTSETPISRSRKL